MRTAALALSLALAGCGAYARDLGRTAAEGALEAEQSVAAQRAIDSLAASASGAAATSAADATRVVLESPATRRDLEDLAAGFRREVLATRDSVLDETLRTEVAAIREEAVGAPLRADVDRLIDEASPRLADAVAKAVAAGAAPIEASAHREVGYLRDVAVGLAVAAAALLLALGFAVYELRRHRAELNSMLLRMK